MKRKLPFSPVTVQVQDGCFGSGNAASVRQMTTSLASFLVNDDSGSDAVTVTQSGEFVGISATCLPPGPSRSLRLGF